MNVADIMTANPTTVSAKTPVEQVARVLADGQIPGVPVIGPAGELLGMITEEDLIMRNANLHLPTFLNVLDGFFPVRGRHAFEEEVRHRLATRADQVMSERLFTVTPDTDVADAATQKEDLRSRFSGPPERVEKHANPLPVVANGRLAGIVSRSGIVRLMARDAADAGTPPGGA
jgi:CBS domain-containing protein